MKFEFLKTIHNFRSYLRGLLPPIPYHSLVGRAPYNLKNLEISVLKFIFPLTPTSVYGLSYLSIDFRGLPTSQTSSSYIMEPVGHREVRSSTRIQTEASLQRNGIVSGLRRSSRGRPLVADEAAAEASAKADRAPSPQPSYSASTSGSAPAPAAVKNSKIDFLGSGPQGVVEAGHEDEEVGYETEAEDLSIPTRKRKLLAEPESEFPAPLPTIPSPTQTQSQAPVSHPLPPTLPTSEIYQDQPLDLSVRVTPPKGYSYPCPKVESLDVMEIIVRYLEAEEEDIIARFDAKIRKRMKEKENDRKSKDTERNVDLIELD